MGSFDYKMSLNFVVFLCLIFNVSAWDGKCPDHVETMPDFNPELYLGDWYNVAAIYNGRYIDETSSCIRASYKELSMSVFRMLMVEVWFYNLKKNISNQIHQQKKDLLHNLM